LQNSIPLRIITRNTSYITRKIHMSTMFLFLILKDSAKSLKETLNL